VPGLDLSDVQVRMAKRKLRKRIAAGTAEIVKGDASRLPWEDESFSVTAIMGSFIGFAKPLESLKEMCRVLCPGGRAVISLEFNAEDGGKDHSKWSSMKAFIFKCNPVPSIFYIIDNSDETIDKLGK